MSTPLADGRRKIIVLLNRKVEEYEFDEFATGPAARAFGMSVRFRANGAAWKEALAVLTAYYQEHPEEGPVDPDSADQPQS